MQQTKYNGVEVERALLYNAPTRFGLLDDEMSERERGVRSRVCLCGVIHFCALARTELWCPILYEDSLGNYSMRSQTTPRVLFNTEL